MPLTWTEAEATWPAWSKSRERIWEKRVALPFMMVGLFPKASRRVDRACHFSTAEHRPRGHQENREQLIPKAWAPGCPRNSCPGIGVEELFRDKEPREKEAASWWIVLPPAPPPLLLSVFPAACLT